jgi:hypothetical protein
MTLYYLYVVRNSTGGIISNPPQGSCWSYLRSAYKKRGHWSPRTCISPLLSLALILQKTNTVNGLIPQITSTYPGSSQFTPAGQSSEPVASWWKPQSNFILWLSGGIIDWPGGVIQSMIVPFMPLESSALAALAPHWICPYIKKKQRTLFSALMRLSSLLSPTYSDRNLNGFRAVRSEC